MALRKKKTTRDHLEAALAEARVQAEELRQQVAERAPEVRDQLVTRASDGAQELQKRLPEWRDSLLERAPELSKETYDKLPQGVADRLPDEVKPKKKRRVRKLLFGGLVIGAGAAAFAGLRGKQNPPPPYQPAGQSSTPQPSAPSPAAPPQDPATTTAAPPTAGDVAANDDVSPSAGGPNGKSPQK